MTSVTSTSEKRSSDEIAIHGTTAENKSVFASATLHSDDISTTSKSTMPEAPNLFTSAYSPSPADASTFRRYYDMPPEANQDSDLTSDIVECLSTHGSPELKARIRAIGSRQSVSTCGATKSRGKSRGRISRQSKSKMITLLQKNIAVLEAEQQRSNSVTELLMAGLKAEKEENQPGMLPSSESGSGITITLDGSAADTITIKRNSREIEVLGEKKNKKKPSRAQHRQKQVVRTSDVKKTGNISKKTPSRAQHRQKQVVRTSDVKKTGNIFKKTPPTRPPKKDTQKPRTKRKHRADKQQEQRKRKQVLQTSQAKAPADALTSASTSALVEIPRAGDKRKYPADAVTSTSISALVEIPRAGHKRRYPADAVASASTGAPVEIPRAGDKRKYPANTRQDSARKRIKLDPAVNDIVNQLQSLRIAPVKQRCRRRRG